MLSWLFAFSIGAYLCSLNTKFHLAGARLAAARRGSRRELVRHERRQRARAPARRPRSARAACACAAVAVRAALAGCAAAPPAARGRLGAGWGRVQVCWTPLERSLKAAASCALRSAGACSLLDCAWAGVCEVMGWSEIGPVKVSVVASKLQHMLLLCSCTDGIRMWTHMHLYAHSPHTGPAQGPYCGPAG